jgi:ABC-type antimicrobial peptide transport system permease subunit
MSLGADRGNVLAMMLWSAMSPISVGLVVGVVVALANGSVIASQLYGVKSYDPLVMLGAVLVLLFSAVLAAIVPARRAASIDPIRALRTE